MTLEDGVPHLPRLHVVMNLIVLWHCIPVYCVEHGRYLAHMLKDSHEAWMTDLKLCTFLLSVFEPVLEGMAGSHKFDTDYFSDVF